MSSFLVDTFAQFLAHDLHVSGGNASKMWPPLLDSLYPCLRPVTDLATKLSLLCQRAFANRLQCSHHLHHFVEYWCGAANFFPRRWSKQALMEQGLTSSIHVCTVVSTHVGVVSGWICSWAYVNIVFVGLDHLVLHLSYYVWRKVKGMTGISGGETQREHLSGLAIATCR